MFSHGFGFHYWSTIKEGNEAGAPPAGHGPMTSSAEIVEYEPSRSLLSEVACADTYLDTSKAKALPLQGRREDEKERSVDRQMLCFQVLPVY